MAPPRKLSETHNIFVDAIAEKIIKARNENGGKTPRCLMLKYLKDLQRENIPVTREMMKHRIKFLESANVLDQLLTHHSKKEGTRRRHEALAEGVRRRATFDGVGRITSGVVIKQRMHGIANAVLLDAVRERDDLKEAEATRKINEENRKLLDLKRKLDEMRETKGSHDPSKWNSSDCKSYLRYKKQKGEKEKMPTLIVELREQCRKWIHRPSPNPTPCTSDAEDQDHIALNETEDVAWIGDI